jgi:hypothetical protein
MAVLEGVEPVRPATRGAARDRSRVAWIAGFVVYSVLIALIIPKHEPWFDEIQAWLIARDSNPVNLFGRLAYEGQPGLWHLILMLPARTLPVAALNWISAALGAAGVYVFLRKAPFPTPLKLLVPFTFFFFYQYAVVARNYVLVPLVLFSLAALYPRRHERPVLFAVVLFILANTSAHGFLISSAILAIYLVEHLNRYRKSKEWPGRATVASIVVLGLSMLAVAVALIPPSDRSSVRDGVHIGPRTFLRVAGPLMNTSMATNWVVLVLALGASLWFFRRTRVLHIYATIMAFLLCFMVFVYHAPWHEGMLFLVWLFVFWQALQRSIPGSITEDRPRLAALTMLTVVLLVQVSWTVLTVIDDARGTYSGSRGLATYIKENNLDDREIYAVNWAALAVNGYFDDNVFANYPPKGLPERDIAYWVWTKRYKMADTPKKIEAAAPDFVVYTIKGNGAQTALTKGLKSYEERAVFWGETFWKGGALEPDVYMLLERKSERAIAAQAKREATKNSRGRASAGAS